MLRKLWCWLVGWPCSYTDQSKIEITRGAHGIFVNTPQPMVREQTVVQQCKVCGETRTCRTTVG